MVEAPKKKPGKSLYAKATNTGVNAIEAAKRLKMDWDSAAEIEDADTSDERDVPSIVCAVIQLPSQTLLLSVSDKACRLIGMLFPGDMVVFKPQISSQQQQHHQQMQPQMQQQIPQLQQQQHQQMQPQMQQQQQLPQLQQQLSQMQQQQQQLQQQQLQQLQQLQQQQQQLPPLQQQQQQMVGQGMVIEFQRLGESSRHSGLYQFASWKRS